MTTKRPVLRLLPNDRAVIELPEGVNREEVETWRDMFHKAWVEKDPIFLSRFEVIDQSQPDIESRLAAVESWLEDIDTHLSTVETRLNELDHADDD